MLSCFYCFFFYNNNFFYFFNCFPSFGTRNQTNSRLRGIQIGDASNNPHGPSLAQKLLCYWWSGNRDTLYGFPNSIGRTICWGCCRFGPRRPCWLLKKLRMVQRLLLIEVLNCANKNESTPTRSNPRSYGITLRSSALMRNHCRHLDDCQKQARTAASDVEPYMHWAAKTNR